MLMNEQKKVKLVPKLDHSRKYMSTYLHETFILDAILERQKNEARKYVSTNLHEIQNMI